MGAADVAAAAASHRSPDGPAAGRGLPAAAQHGRGQRHLPGTRHNVDVVGRLRLAPAVPGRIGDVGVHRRHAYLAAFRYPRCQMGGVYVVSLANPARPRRIGFIRAAPDSFVGEGVQVKSIRTRAFRGDLLVHNNEICGPDKRAQGGISLYDVTRPSRPRLLAAGVGDHDLPNGSTIARAHMTHSAYLWQAGGRAFVVSVDDEDPEDIDILEVTDPRRPRLISETDLTRYRVEQSNVNGQTPFLHDMVVKRIGGRWTMLASYWDGGFAQVDVDDPAKPRLIRDTDYRRSDPQRAGRGHVISAEGNAHQAEFSHNNRWFLGADEDFLTHRVFAQIADGPHAGTYVRVVQGTPSSPLEAAEAKRDDGGGARIGPRRRRLVGRTVFAGLACDPGQVPPATATRVKVAVVERGICLFTDKARAVAAAGYEAMVILNRTGPDGGCDNVLGLIIDTPIPALMVPRSDGFRLLNAYDPATYFCREDVPAGTPTPPIGTFGAALGVRATFDGWGYLHLYERRTGREVDTYAIEEAQRTQFATDHGDLSVHEVATDPDTNLAYLAYYAGGLRVVSFGPRGIRELGRFISVAGNNFWGVEVFRHPDGNKYILASDRETGLWVFRYTGPGSQAGAG